MALGEFLALSSGVLLGLGLTLVRQADRASASVSLVRRAGGVLWGTGDAGSLLCRAVRALGIPFLQVARG